MFKTAKQQVAFIAGSAALSVFSLVALVMFSDPKTAGWTTLGFFYLSLILSLLAIFTLFGLALRHWLSGKIFLLNLKESFRQALLISLLVASVLLLLSLKMMFWWVALSLVLFFVALEFFFSAKL